MQEDLYDNDNLIIRRKRTQLSSKDFLLKYLRYWPWIIISLFMLLFLAYMKLRYSTPIYSISGKILVKNDRVSGGANEKFEDIFMMQGASNNLNDEIEILKSRTMAARVINSLKFQLSIGNKGNIRLSEIHPADVPFKFDIISLKDSLASFSLSIIVLNNKEFKLNNNNEIFHFGQVIALPSVQFRILSSKNSNLAYFPSNIFVFSWQPLEASASGLSKALRVEQVGDFTNVLNLSYETSNPHIGLSIVNQYMQEYMKSSREDKIQQSESMLSFINEQLDTVKQELSGVERNLQKNREKNRRTYPYTTSNRI
jgi:tyrosine-protein kinase Etk/Wzc